MKPRIGFGFLIQENQSLRTGYGFFFYKKSSRVRLKETKNWVCFFEPEQSDSIEPFIMELLLSSLMVQTDERESTLVSLTTNLRIEGYRTR